jgi:redox-sensitive bicupin YhaK (pirin superfamily)
MMTVRKSNERGGANHGWLKSQHTFSFADYFDPEMMGFGPLRVINEDYIASERGFGAHPHRDMEIITYVVDGEIHHRDSMGNEGVILPGEVQHMTAGTGVVHSEFSGKVEGDTHLLQIWIVPDRAGHRPGYGQKSFSKEIGEKALVEVASPDGRDGSLAIHQDARLYVSRTRADEALTFEVGQGRRVWLQLVRGHLSVTGADGSTVDVRAGDGVAITRETELRLKSQEPSEALIFDLP